jgi:hypothetical protein
MGTNIRCYTLFDITKTDITSRRPPLDMTNKDASEWEHKRNTQCNLDTIIQVISLRAQLENITHTTNVSVNLSEFEKFGFLIDSTEPCNVYSFDFFVNHSGVFMENDKELGALDTDCAGVPMIKIHNKYITLPNFLDTTPELRNIYFEILSYE